MCDCWVTPGRAEGDQGGAARWCSTVCPCLSFPTCKAGGAPGAAGAVGGSRPTAILLQPRAGGFPDSPPRLLALSSLPPRTTPAQGAGPAPVGQGQAFPWGGGGGEEWSKIRGPRNFFTVFRSYARHHHPLPFVSPKIILQRSLC